MDFSDGESGEDNCEGGNNGDVPLLPLFHDGNETDVLVAEHNEEVGATDGKEIVAGSFEGG